MNHLLRAWLGVLSAGCAERLPEDVSNYTTECQLMNQDPIASRGADDPHQGTKNVYACNAVPSELQPGGRPFSDGTIIVKEAARSDFVWLVSTARKINGSWQWDEYTRNFEDEGLVHILAGEGTCIDCHQQARAPALDWIFTQCSVEACLPASAAP